MSGLIGTGETYKGRAMSGIIRGAALQDTIDAENDRLKAAKKVQQNTMGGQMAGIGALAGGKAASALMGSAAPAIAADTGLAIGAAGTEAAISGIATGAGAAGAGAAGAAGGAAAGAAAGSVVPVVGTLVGMGLGLLASRLF